MILVRILYPVLTNEINKDFFYVYAAMGPIRLFTPYKRKRKINPDMEEKKPKVKHESSLGDSDVDNIHQTSNNSHSKEAWQTIAEGLDSSTEYHLLDTPEPAKLDHNTGKYFDFYISMMTSKKCYSEGK